MKIGYLGPKGCLLYTSWSYLKKEVLPVVEKSFKTAAVSELKNIASSRRAYKSFGICLLYTSQVITGETVKIGVFSQDNGEMNPEQKVIDYIRDVAEYLPTADGRISASQMLERFLFPDALQYAPIGKLSGGEKRRLYLLKVLMDAPNVLVLDEPTNDLDISTLAILEDYLDHFSGEMCIRDRQWQFVFFVCC